MIQRYFLHFNGRDKTYIYTINIHYTLFQRRTLALPPLVDTDKKVSLDSLIFAGEKTNLFMAKQFLIFILRISICFFHKLFFGHTYSSIRGYSNLHWEIKIGLRITNAGSKTKFIIDNFIKDHSFKN